MSDGSVARGCSMKHLHPEHKLLSSRRKHYVYESLILVVHFSQNCPTAPKEEYLATLLCNAFKAQIKIKG